MKTKKANKEYLIVVSYDIDFYLNDTGDSTLDSLISKTLRKEKSGSGAGFGRRDIDFYYKTKAGADSAVSRISKMAKIKEYKRFKISACLGGS